MQFHTLPKFFVKAAPVCVAAALLGACVSAEDPAQGLNPDAGDSADFDAAPPAPDAAAGSNQAWALVMGGSGNDEAWGVAVGNNGSVYAIGVFSGEGDFGGKTLSSSGASDVFVTAISNTGEVEWAHAIGGPDADLGQAIAVDSAGNLYLTGAILGSSLVSDGSIECSTEARDTFLVSLTPSGDFRWGKCLGGDQSFGRGRDLRVSANGNVYLAGWFTGTASFGGPNLQSGLYGPDAYVAAFDPLGKHLWSRSYGGAMSDTANKLVVDDSNGAVYVTGSFIGPATFDDVTLLGANSSFDMYLMKLNASGEKLWLNEFSSPGSEEGLGLTLNSDGQLGFSGVYEGPLSLGDATMTAVDQHDLFVASFTASGEASWSAGFGGLGFDQALDMNSYSDPNAPVYVAGRYDDSLSFGETVLTTSGGYDGFCAAFSPDGAPLWATSMGGSGNDLARDVAAFGDGAVLGGVAHDGLVIDGQVYPGWGGGDAYVAQVIPEHDLSVD